MAPAADVDLYAPFEKDVILEVRSSKMKPMPGLSVLSGIDKLVREGRVPVSMIGLDEDEHDLVFHGGPDKAILGYCSSHYPDWQTEYPEAASRFQPGAFGENFVTRHMNERNVCVGDLHQVGEPGIGPLLQVSLPRQPCFKLNHRFQLKNFAPKVYAASRTGWYYRVLKEGTVAAGDEIRLVERRWPKWTIEQVQEYLHRTQDDHAMNEELAGVEDMGIESRGNFQKRVAKQKARERKAAAGEDSSKAEKWKQYRIAEKKRQTDRIASFVLEAVENDPEAGEAQLGSHARLKLPNGLIRTYSIVSGNPNRFELGIALEEASRGGSKFMHGTTEGDVIQVGRITSDVQPKGAASQHVFIAGGIGITAFLAMLDTYRQIHWQTVLHYAVRSESDIPFRETLDLLGDAVKVYDASKGQRMDIPAIMKNMGWNSHVYVCGPSRMMDEALRVSKETGLTEADIHFEAFAADTTGDPFEVEVANRGDKRLQVGEEETLLEVLKKHFDDVASSCEVGNCGTCKVNVKCGNVEHRGTALMGDEKKDSMLSCVSRGMGKIVIEI
ncbi:pyruvate kinase-like protein [Apiospora sp. TS-2023a]